MNNFLITDSTFIVLSEYYENFIANKYNDKTEYQREYIWNVEKKRFLLDTILKNFPIPPVFLRMNIDEETGITKYDVIDGKQRLNTIVEFIEGELTLPDSFGEGVYGNEQLNGLSFKDLDSFPEYKKRFWRYKIPVIYIDDKDSDTIREVFDRLNRNGEPLTAQELRHAKYSAKDFYKLIERLSNLKFWKLRLQNLDITRMENVEFISELLTLLIEHKAEASSKEILDHVYENWNESTIDYKQIEKKFIDVTNYMKDLDIDYDTYKISGVSHLYAIWGLAICCFEEGCVQEEISDKLKEFYDQLRNRTSSNINIINYKDSMSAGTKGRTRRKKRIDSLIQYIQDKGIGISQEFIIK